MDFVVHRYPTDSAWFGGLRFLTREVQNLLEPLPARHLFTMGSSIPVEHSRHPTLRHTPGHSSTVSGAVHNNGMADLYTKNGRPLRRDGDRLFARSGTYVGRILGDRVFDPSGRYAGTIVGDRVVYRSTHSARIAGPSVSANRVGSAGVNRVASAMWGDEPPFPD